MEPPIAFELVATNDIAPIEKCAYLLELDSVYGLAPATIVQTKRALTLNGYPVRLTQQHDLISVDMSDVDVVVKCTGKANDPNFASAQLRSGAKRVLILGPSEHADVMVVLGANDNVLQGQRIISNASCRTNALAPLLCVLDDSFMVLAGHMTTIHCDTGSQPTIDAPHGATLE